MKTAHHNKMPSESRVRSASAGRRMPFDSVQQEAFLNLWRTYDRLKVLEEEVFARVDLSAQQYNTLRLLQSVHPGSMPTLLLGERLITRAPDMTRLLDKLEDRGLLARQRRIDNRRIVDVHITRQGLKLLHDFQEDVTNCHRRQLGHLKTTELRQLIHLLKLARQPHEDQQCPSLVDNLRG